LPIPTTRKKREADRRRRERNVFVLLCIFLIGVAGGAWLLSDRIYQLSTATVGGPFQLTASDGRTVSDKDFHGKYLLIFFGFTSCPDICPTTLQSVGAAVDTLGPKADMLQPLFITVDPKRDTPAVLAQYTAAFSSRLLGLTGTPEQIMAVEKEYKVYAAKNPSGSGESIDHSSALYLVGPNGRFIAPLKADASGDEIANIIRHFMS